MQQSDIWERTSALLKKDLPGHSFRMWIEPLSASISDGCLNLSCPNLFSKNRVEGNYLPNIQEALEKARNGDGPMQVKLTVSQKEKEQEEKLPATRKHFQPTFPPFAAITTAKPVLRKEFTLPQFVVGPFNKFAHDIALNTLLTEHAFQPVLLLSKTGLGKSHLEQALTHHILEQDPLTKILYIPAPDFMGEYVMACKNNSQESFREKFRNGCDILLVDDIHYLQNKKGTQSELHLVIDHLLNAGKKIIFSSMLLPADIPKMDSQLTSRFSASTISEIVHPGFKDRLRILRKAATTNGDCIPCNILEFLASELTSDIRQLKSGLIGVIARSSLIGAPPSIASAQQVVTQLAQQQKLVTPELIKKIVAENFGVKLAELSSRSRSQRVVVPRQIAMYLCRQECSDLSLSAIGGAFNRYHATVLHSLGVVERKIRDKNHAFIAKLEIIEKKLKEAL